MFFLSIFLNPNLLKASDEIKNQEPNSILIKEAKSKTILQKDLYLLGNGDSLDASK